MNVPRKILGEFRSHFVVVFPVSKQDVFLWAHLPILPFRETYSYYVNQLRSHIYRNRNKRMNYKSRKTLL